MDFQVAKAGDKSPSPWKCPFHAALSDSGLGQYWDTYSLPQLLGHLISNYLSLYSFSVPTSSECPATIRMLPRVPPLAFFSSRSLWSPLLVITCMMVIPTVCLLSLHWTSSFYPIVCGPSPPRCITTYSSSIGSKLNSFIPTLQIHLLVLYSPFRWLHQLTQTPNTDYSLLFTSRSYELHSHHSVIYSFLHFLSYLRSLLHDLSSVKQVN